MHWLRRGSVASLAAAVTAAVLLAACSSPGGSAGSAGSSGSSGASPIPVGVIQPLTGSDAGNGKADVEGYDLGLDTFGSSVDGHPIKTTVLDSGGEPTTALSDAHQLVQRDHVAMVNGPQLSSALSAVTPYWASTDTPVDDQTACSAIQLNDYKSYGNGFSSDWSCDQPALMGAEWLSQDMHIKHVVTLAIDISFGWETVGSLQKVLTADGGSVTKKIWVPANAVDLSSYVAQIPRNTQAVFAVVAGAQAVSFMSYYKSYGMQGKVPLLGITNATDPTVLPSEGDSVIGDYSAAQYCDGIPTAANQKFVAAYHEKFGTYPGYFAEGAYVQAEIEVAAFKKLHGDVTNPKALASALRSVQISAPRGPVSISPQTLTPVQNVYICKVELVHGALMNVPVKTYTNVQPNGPLPYSTWLSLFMADSSGPPR